MNKKESSPELKNMKFEEAIKKLENIVQKLEGGEASLEDSLSLYEEGIALFRFCSSKLEEAKKKVEILTKKGSGERLVQEPFKPEKYGINKEESKPEEGSENEEIPF